MFKIDSYSLKARTYPMLIVLAPLILLAISYSITFDKYNHIFTSVFFGGLLTYILSHLGRDIGKSKEVDLFKNWGGKPSVSILRHKDQTIDKYTKERYHSILSNLLKRQLPTFDEEKKDPSNSDEIYESCTIFLISKTRDINKFSLLFKENVSYGFRRNLWGLKPYAIFIWFLSVLLNLAFLYTDHLLNTNFIFNKVNIIIGSLYVFYLLFILFIVNPNWIKVTAVAYAKNLLESINLIE